METSLHKQLKARYAGEDAPTEVRLGAYRIDVVRDDLLIEIQHGGLAAIRDKVHNLLKNHDVLVVKPIIATKTLVKKKRKNGAVTSRRRSPKRGKLLDLFHDLVHFTRVFPHPRLTLEVAMVDVEEWRHPGHGRRRRWRANDFLVDDQKLLEVVQVHSFRSEKDLAALLPEGLPSPFDTGQLAAGLEIDRWFAQRIAYGLRETGATQVAGKRGNAILYEIPSKRPRSKKGPKTRAA